MHKFSIFEKSNKFYWSTNKIFYSTLFFCIGILYLKKEVFHLEKNAIDTILQSIAVLTIAVGIFTMLRGITQVEPLRGKLNGYLIFSEDFIQIKEEILPIDKIRKIKISNDDYNGLRQSSKGNFGPSLSNGTNNFVVIFFESNETRKIQYELYNSDDFQKIRQILISYHLRGKMDFWEVANVLGEKSTTEVREFKNEIEKMRTTANSGFVQ